MNIMLFGIYLFVLVVIFIFISIVVLHIGNFREYSRYLSVVLRLYLIALIVIGIFGGYMILTSDHPVVRETSTPVQKVNF